MVDIQALDEVITQIKAHPELHDQEVFFAQTECGTAGCVAGWRVLLDGGEPHTYDNGTVSDLYANLPGSVKPIDIPEYAQRRFGLDNESADVLFAPGNTLADIERMRDVLAEQGRLTWDEDGMHAGSIDDE